MDFPQLVSEFQLPLERPRVLKISRVQFFHCIVVEAVILLVLLLLLLLLFLSCCVPRQSMLLLLLFLFLLAPDGCEIVLVSGSCSLKPSVELLVGEGVSNSSEESTFELSYDSSHISVILLYMTW